MKAFDIRITATEEYYLGDSPTETLMFDAGVRWALKQIQADLKHFISQIKETDGYYKFELDDLPRLCKIEDDK